MKKIILLMMCIVLISCVSADVLNPVKKGETTELIQICDNCTYVNVTFIQFPNKSIDNTNLSMTKDGSNYNRTFTDTKQVGWYLYNTCGDKNGVNACEEFTFEVTTTGDVLSTGDSILYLIMSIIFFGLILIQIYFIIALPGENERDERGTIMGIVKLKYFRIVLIALLYPMIILLLNFLNGLAVNFDSLSMFSGILGFLFSAMLSVAWVFTIIIIVWIIYLLIQDSNIKRTLKKIENFRII